MTTKLGIVLEFDGAPIRFSLVNGLAIVQHNNSQEPCLSVPGIEDGAPQSDAAILLHLAPDRMDDDRRNPRHIYVWSSWEDLLSEIAGGLQLSPRCADMLKCHRLSN